MQCLGAGTAKFLKSAELCLRQFWRFWKVRFSHPRPVCASLRLPSLRWGEEVANRRGSDMDSLRDKFVPVTTILLALVVVWYIGAVFMNAPFQRDLDRR